MDTSCHRYEWVMSHIWTRHATHTDESRHTHEQGTSQIRMGHVTHMDTSWHTYEHIMSHIRMSHVTHTNESCHTYRHTISHIHMSLVTLVNASRHTCEWVMSHMWMSHEYVMFYMCMSHVSHMNTSWYLYGVATISRLLKITGLFCKRAQLKRWFSAKETYDFKKPANRSHPICIRQVGCATQIGFFFWGILCVSRPVYIYLYIHTWI